MARRKPAKARRKATRKPPEQHSEQCLHMHCQQFLEKSGVWSRLLIFHVANERMGSIGAAMHFKRMGVRKGVADYLAFPPGRPVAIELKDDEGEQDSDQIKFQKKWEAAGNLYLVARTLPEFQGIINAITLFV